MVANVKTAKINDYTAADFVLPDRRTPSKNLGSMFGKQFVVLEKSWHSQCRTSSLRLFQVKYSKMLASECVVRTYSGLTDCKLCLLLSERCIDSSAVLELHWLKNSMFTLWSIWNVPTKITSAFLSCIAPQHRLTTSATIRYLSSPSRAHFSLFLPCLLLWTAIRSVSSLHYPDCYLLIF